MLGRRASVEDMNEIMRRSLNSNTDFWKALENIVKPNADGLAIYLVGGTVYRTIASELYGGDRPSNDLDFAIGRRSSHPNAIVPKGWNVKEKSHFSTAWQYEESLVFTKGNQSVDVFTFDDLDAVRGDDGKAIERYLRGVPLTIQSIMYDLRTNQLRGPAGINALRNRNVRVNNQEALEFSSKCDNISSTEYIQRKTQDLPGFRVEYSTAVAA